jgi:hypothetical protein
MVDTKGWACRTHRTDGNAHRSPVKKSEGRDHLGHECVNDRIILKKHDEDANWIHLAQDEVVGCCC